MRLIDADELKRWLNGYIDTDNLSPVYMRSLIDTRSTVDAIPVEWIKKWLNNIANNERYKNEYVELTEEVKRIVYRQTMIINMPCISDMLEDWEKENGTR